MFCSKCTGNSLCRLLPSANPAVDISRSQTFELDGMKLISMYAGAAVDESNLHFLSAFDSNDITVDITEEVSSEPANQKF